LSTKSPYYYLPNCVPRSESTYRLSLLSDYYFIIPFIEETLGQRLIIDQNAPFSFCFVKSTWNTVSCLLIAFNFDYCMSRSIQSCRKFFRVVRIGIKVVFCILPQHRNHNLQYLCKRCHLKRRIVTRSLGLKYIYQSSY
jgi:hypothetical protein